jgi:exopolysaccharide biosynthesis polyprenyl glycosylphosphotransferase
MASPMIRLFNVSIPSRLVSLVVMETLIIGGCYLLAGLLLFNPSIDPWFYISYEYGWLQILLAVTITQLGLYMLDLYSLQPTSTSYLIQQMCLALGLSFLAQALIGYSQEDRLQLPQWTMLGGSLLILVLVPLWRQTYFRLLSALPINQLMFLGRSPLMEEIVTTVQQHPELGFAVVGYLDADDQFAQAPYLGPAETLQNVVEDHKTDRIVVSTFPGLPTQSLLNLRMSGVYLEDTATLYEELFGRVSIQTLQPHHLLFSKDMKPPEWAIRLQTIYSFVGGVVGLLLSLPVLLIVALAVRLTSKGPVLYSQERVGKSGAHFRLYKFRSMYVDAEARTGPVWATQNDPRVTPLGRWLRKFRLDELPQFFNVIRGEMMLVGPRPERPEFCSMLEQRIPFYHQRHSVKPGITGWAQINHKYAETIEDTIAKLEYDLYYIKNLSPSLDAYIIFHTLKVMLLFRGAQ